MFTASFEINRNKTITFISKGLEYFIPEPEILPGKTIDRVTNFIPDIRKFINPALKGEGFELQVSFTFPDKRQREIRVSITPVKDRDHLISSVLFVLMELKPDKHIKKTGDEYTKKDLLSILESTPEGVVVVDKSWVIRFMNPAAGRILDKSRNELTGTEYPYRLTRRKKKEVSIELADGTLRIIEMQSSRFVWEKKPAQIIYLKDICAERIVRDGLMNVITDAVVFLDNTGKPWHYNKLSAQIFHITENQPEKNSIIAQMGEYFKKEDAFIEKAEHLLSSDEAFFDTLHHRDGWIFEWFSHPVFLHGKKIGRIMSFHDSTRQTLAGARMKRQNRFYAMLSGVNQALVRTQSIREMTRETCRVAVNEGGFSLVWTAFADKNADVFKVIHAEGDDPELSHRFSGKLSKMANIGLPAAKVCITGKPVVMNDIRKEFRGKIQREILRSGYLALASYPIRVKGKIRGSFTVCSKEPGIFQQQEKALLKKVAGDISSSLEPLKMRRSGEMLSGNCRKMKKNTVPCSRRIWPECTIQHPTAGCLMQTGG